MRVWSLLTAGVCAVGGCGAGGPGASWAPVPPTTTEGFVRIHAKQPIRFSLQALLTANRERLHHVNLRLFRRAESGTWLNTPVAVRLGVVPAELSGPIGLGTLKFGTVYRLELEAYADAAESASTLISDPAGSQVTFQMPSPVVNGTVVTVERQIVISAPLVLLNTTYVGTASYSLVVNNNAVNHVRLELITANAVIASQMSSLSQAPPVGTLTNLKLGTTYTLRAIGQRGASNNAQPLSTASATFTTPTVSASGTVETGPFGPFALTLD